MKKLNIIYILVTIVVMIFASLFYFDYLQNKKASLQKITYDKEVQAIKNNLDLLILTKKKATLAVAIALANDKTLIQELKSKHIDEKRYQKIIQSFKQNTLYKDIWIQVVDKNAVSMYRSWTSTKGDGLAKYRPEFQNLTLKTENYTSISVGRYNLSIKSIAPIVNNGEVLGAIEIISHFNSTTNILQQEDIESIIILKKEYTKQLKYPFTKLFLDDTYYIANIDASKEYRDYLSSNNVNRYFNDNYKLENGYLIISSAIKDVNNKILGYAIMFKKLQDISTLELKYFMFKYISLFIILVLIAAVALVVLLFTHNKKQKEYYQNILDSSTNIVVVTDGQEISYANEIFFHYFKQYENLEAMSKQHFCICDLFIKEDGFIQKNMNGVSWIEYLTSKNVQINKAKIKVDNNIYIFVITISKLKEYRGKVLVILEDVTSQETLLNMSITDELTQIGNRRHFNLHFESEVSRSKRYENHLSLIMCDIDFFKDVNDKYGHDKGDEVLVNYAQLISSHLRNEDIFCRVGGEEFTILLPNTGKDNAQKLAEKLRIVIEQYKISLAITMSFGVVELSMDENAGELYKRADEALYQAKESGRNRVVVG